MHIHKMKKKKRNQITLLNFNYYLRVKSNFQIKFSY